MNKSKAKQRVDRLNRKKINQKIFINALISLALIIPAVFIYRSCNQSPDSSAQQIKGAIIIECQKAIKSGLTNPSTAQWPSTLIVGEHLHKLNDSKYAFKSYVESENDFGISSRIDFTCYVTVDGDIITIDEIEYQ